MADFQVVLGIIMIITSIIIVLISVFNIIIMNKATTKNNDSKALLLDTEKRGSMAASIAIIFLGLVIFIFGIIVLLPKKRSDATINENNRVQAAKSFGSSVLI